MTQRQNISLTAMLAQESPQPIAFSYAQHTAPCDLSVLADVLIDALHACKCDVVWHLTPEQPVGIFLMKVAEARLSLLLKQQRPALWRIACLTCPDGSRLLGTTRADLDWIQTAIVERLRSTTGVGNLRVGYDHGAE